MSVRQFMHIYRGGEAASTKTISPKPVEVERNSGVPALYRQAPHVFRRTGNSGNLAKSWKVTRFEAVDQVLRGLCEAVYGPEPRVGRPQLVKRAA